MTVECENEKYIIITKQVRLPSGGVREEIPAGMIDAEQNICGVAIKELEEETGIVVPSTEHLLDLGTFYPSPGACDELIQLYAFDTKITNETMDELAAKVHGVDANEQIRIELAPLRIYHRRLMEMGDAKAEVAFWRSKVVKADREVQAALLSVLMKE